MKTSNERERYHDPRSIDNLPLLFIVCNTRIDDPRLHEYAIFHDEKGHIENVSLNISKNLCFFFLFSLRVSCKTCIPIKKKRDDGIKTILFLLFSFFFLEKKRRENVIDFTKGDIGKKEREIRYLIPSLLSPVDNEETLKCFFFFPASSTCVQTPIGWFRIPATLRPAARW